jgi:PAS domain S-box-containing protein
MKLSIKFFIIISEIAIIPLLITGYIAYFNVYQAITQNIFNNLSSDAQIQKNRIEDTFRQNDSLLSLFNTKSLMLKHLSEFNSNSNSEAQQNLIGDITSATAGSQIINNVLIADPAGKIVASTAPGFIGKNISNDDFFKKGMVKNEVSYLEKNPSTGKVERYLSGPLMLNGKIIGVSVLICNTDDLNSITSDYTGLGSTGEILLAKKDDNGDALFLNSIRFDKNSALTRIVPKTQTNVPVTNAVAGEEDFFDNLVDYRGVPVFSATRYISSVGWGIVVKIDKSEALAPAFKEQILSVSILLLVTLLVIVISFSTSFYITNPIKKIVAVAKKITEGDLSKKINIKSKDEIGNLSYYLNKMVASLKDSAEKYKHLTINLEKEVKAQTSKLENQNIFLTEANKAMVNLSEDLEQEKNKLSVEKTNNEAILTSVGDGLVATDKDGTIIIINPAAEKLFGYDVSEVVGKSIFDAIQLEDESGKFLPKEKRPLYITFSKKQIVNATYNCLRKDKSKFIASITSSPIILDGKVIGAVDIFRDITKEKEIDKAKTEFVSLASHQLRTPTTAVKWYAEMLMEKDTGKLNKKQLKYLMEVYRGNEREIKLIDNLLSVSRIELGKMPVKNEMVDTKKLLSDIVAEQKPEAEKRKHELIVEVAEKIPPISTDPALLRMILQNFVSNAIKYTLDNGKIICAIKTDKSKILFSVADTGVGIPKEEQSKIFGKLFRASNSLALDKAGNGLGLYIVKQVAISLGGRVWFESELGKGTTFYLELPLKTK